MSEPVRYSYLSSLRHGLASALRAKATGERVTLDVELTARAKQKGSENQVMELIQQKVQLYGPGDVLGFDPRIVVRTEPAFNVGDFEPNFFPFIEFADPDFVWRFTAEAADGKGSLAPWITLIVLIAEGEDCEIGEKGQPQDGLPPWIKVDTANLPDLDEACRWAHVQAVHGDALVGCDPESFAAEMSDLIQSRPECTVSRLLCARRLRPQTLYGAFVVPTFALGRAAGLGEAPTEGSDALTLAWEQGEGEIRLPYYYDWQFRTGSRGDFEYLVRLLEPRALTDIGLRPIDCRSPGYNIPGAEGLELEGALMSLDAEFSRWGKDAGEVVTFEVMDGLLRIEGGWLKPLATGAAITCETNYTATARIEYGLTTDYGSTMLSGDESTDHEISLAGLTPQTAYHFRVTCVDRSGNSTSTPDLTFTTPHMVERFQERLANDLLNKPITDLQPRAAQVEGEIPAAIGELKIVTTDVGATVSWTTTQETSGRVDYGETSGYGQQEVDEDPQTAHWVILTGLEPETTYHFKITVEGLAGGPVDTPDLTFVTSAEPLPTVVPPIYGRWQAPRLLVDETGGSRAWADTLNLDPRHRIAAGLGTEVIQDQQEPLMASAWEQLGAIADANEVIRRAQVGCEASAAIHDRLRLLNTADFLRVTSPANGRVLIRSAPRAAPSTVKAHLADNARIQMAALDPAFRRICRSRGPIRKRQQQVKGKQRDILERLNAGEGEEDRLLAAGPPPRPHGMIGLCDVAQTISVEVTLPEPGGPGGGTVPGSVDDRLRPGGAPVVRGRSAPSEGTVSPVAGSLRPGDSSLAPGSGVSSGGMVSPPSEPRPSGGTTVQVHPALCEEHITCAAIEEALALPQTCSGVDLPDGLTPDLIRDIACQIVDGWLNDRPEEPEPRDPIDLTRVRDTLTRALDPRKTIPARVRKRLLLHNMAEQGDALQTLMVAPDFPQPMYEPLRDKSQELLLPGIERVPQNTAAVLTTNGRFIESYMCGLNHEFAAELQWRECPASLTATYFRQFWDVDDYIPSPDDYNLETLEQLPYLANRLYKSALELTDDEKLEEALKDIKPIRFWKSSELGNNDNWGAGDKEERIVLIIRGDLLKKYPNTVVYAVTGRPTEGGSRVPDLAEYLEDTEQPGEPIFPLFKGTLPPDITFLGFPFGQGWAEGNDAQNPEGVYFVLEERVSEARFGMDLAGEPPWTKLTTWDDLTWGHIQPLEGEAFPVVPEDTPPAGEVYSAIPEGMYLDGRLPDADPALEPHWDTSAAIAAITLQKPVRIAIHASQMIPEMRDSQTA